MKKVSARTQALWQKKLQLLAAEILRLLHKKERILEVILLSDREMRILEKRYMKKEKKIVDVLSFEHPEDFPQVGNKKKSLGEVYLNWELYPQDFEQLSFLLIHGILHLLGYDHERRSDIIKMEALESKLHAQILRLHTKSKK